MSTQSNMPTLTNIKDHFTVKLPLEIAYTLEQDGEVTLELNDKIYKLISEEKLSQTVTGCIPEWIDNPYGEVNDYTKGRRDERKEIIQSLKDKGVI